jgi:tryptophanyl-tRNA synthetase
MFRTERQTRDNNKQKSTTCTMVMTRRMYKDAEKRQESDVSEKRRKRRKVLCECLELLIDGVEKFKKTLVESHEKYQRNTDDILEKYRTLRVEASGADSKALKNNPSNEHTLPVERDE